MLSEGELRGLKAMASAVLRFALVDAVKGWNPQSVLEFAESDWCNGLCDVVGISWSAYKRGIAERIDRYLERSKPKRIKTYELARVLKDGKDTGKCQSKGNRKVLGAEQESP